MTQVETWFEDMASAMKRRNHAASMLTRWTKVHSDAEEMIVRLSQQVEVQVPQVQEQVQE
jgi:hypothetical protein